MKIEYPTPDEQRAAVRQIREAGLENRHSLFSDFWEMYRSLGLRVIFHDMSDVVFLSAMAVFFVFYFLLGSFRGDFLSRNDVYTVLFTAAPTLYLLLCLLGFWKERMSGTYDIKMSCKFTVCHLTAFRMLLFSCVCILANLALVSVFCAAGFVVDFWQTFLVTASSLFLFSVLLIWSLLCGRGLAASTAAAAVWLPANLLIRSLFRGGYERFLQTMPLCLHIAVTIVLACLYFAGLKRLISQQRERILC